MSRPRLYTLPTCLFEHSASPTAKHRLVGEGREPERCAKLAAGDAGLFGDSGRAPRKDAKALRDFGGTPAGPRAKVKKARGQSARTRSACVPCRWRVYLSTTLRAKVASMPRSFANFEAVFAKKEEKAQRAKMERRSLPLLSQRKVVELRDGFLERFAAELSALEAKVQVFASEERPAHLLGDWAPSIFFFWQLCSPLNLRGAGAASGAVAAALDGALHRDVPCRHRQPSSLSRAVASLSLCRFRSLTSPALAAGCVPAGDPSHESKANSIPRLNARSCSALSEDFAGKGPGARKRGTGVDGRDGRLSCFSGPRWTFPRS